MKLLNTILALFAVFVVLQSLGITNLSDDYIAGQLNAAIVCWIAWGQP